MIIKKKELINWCEENKEILKKAFLCETGNHRQMITDYTSLPVKGYNSGPLGGDQQIELRLWRDRLILSSFFRPSYRTAP